MNKTVILYGSSTGNTQTIAEKLEPVFNADIYDVAKASTDDIDNYDFIIIGVSTWGIGDLQDDWEVFLPKFEKANLKGKHVAIYGLGDADAYPDTFVDGIGTIYNAIKDSGCKVIGFTETEGYSFDDSTALVDGKFAGLPLDEDNESNLTDSRLQKWTEQLKGELM
ncbi:MAG: flavodoxin [Bacteroidota bacterium]